MARLLGAVLNQRGPFPLATHFGYLVAAGGDSVRIPSRRGLIVARLPLTPHPVNTFTTSNLLWDGGGSFFGFVGTKDSSPVGRLAPPPFVATGAARMMMPAFRT